MMAMMIMVVVVMVMIIMIAILVMLEIGNVDGGDDDVCHIFIPLRGLD